MWQEKQQLVVIEWWGNLETRTELIRFLSYDDITTEVVLNYLKNNTAFNESQDSFKFVNTPEVISL